MEHNDALDDLRVIRQVMEQTRRSIAVGGGGYFMIIWGVVWLVGFLGTQFLEGTAEGWLWLSVDALGALASVAVGYRLGTRMRVRPGWRLGLFWLALIVYAGLWAWILLPPDGMRLALFIVTAAMFGYVVMGIWLSSQLIAWVGVGVTALALAGYFLLPAYFAAWMALLGGGTLIGSGLYISRRWR